MGARHVVIHLGVVAGVTVALAAVGLPLATALLAGMVVGCGAMLLGVGHGTGAHRDDADRKR